MGAGQRCQAEKSPAAEKLKTGSRAPRRGPISAACGGVPRISPGHEKGGRILCRKGQIQCHPDDRREEGSGQEFRRIPHLRL